MNRRQQNFTLVLFFKWLLKSTGYLTAGRSIWSATITPLLKTYFSRAIICDGKNTDICMARLRYDHCDCSVKIGSHHKETFTQIMFANPLHLYRLYHSWKAGSSVTFRFCYWQLGKYPQTWLPPPFYLVFRQRCFFYLSAGIVFCGGFLC